MYQPMPKPSPSVVSTPMREWSAWSIRPCGERNSSSSISSGWPKEAFQRHIRVSSSISQAL